MTQSSLFNTDSARAARQPKTDRLILERLLKNEARNFHLTDELIDPAHAILVRWADLETKGRLKRFTETQMQGDVLGEIFGLALGYARFTENAETWNLVQHHEIAGETPDAVLGNFRQDVAIAPLAVIELKGPDVHLDRDRSNGRTAVQQCWDYLNNTQPECRWGIVSNVVSFRLYERNSTRRKYEHFTLQGLRDKDEFKRFFTLLRRDNLITRPSLTERLLAETGQQQATISDKLYDLYSNARTQLIEHLQSLNHSTDDSIEMAQRLLDRVIFIAFCEDRQLLPEKTIEQARTVSGFHDVTNPRWVNFKRLFKFIDVGNLSYNIPKYNGELFKPHQVDELDLPDEPWTNFFESIAKYDFRDEVNLEVLGHLFEKSITELEKFKQVGVYNLTDDRREAFARMPQSVKRKQLGVYYTPAELTSRIVQYTVEELIAERFAAAAVEHGIPAEQAKRGVAPDNDEYWRECLAILQNLKIVDPACGSGAFLFQAYNVLEQRYNEVIGQLDRREAADADELAAKIPHWILGGNLYGVDLSPEAVEITQLALWIRSAAHGQTLASLSHNIVHGNSLVHDPALHPAGFDWHEKFPEVFGRPSTPLSASSGSPLPLGEGQGEGNGQVASTSEHLESGVAVQETLTPNPSPKGRGESEVKGRGEPETKARAEYKALPAELLEFARELRQKSTDAEKLIWGILRNRRLGAFKFRRQHPVEPYVLDFYCHEARLAIELDGGQHNTPAAAAKDEGRSAVLAEQGIRVLRFWNHDVLQDTDTVLEAIWNALHSNLPSPSSNSSLPSPSGRGAGGEGNVRDTSAQRLVEVEASEQRTPHPSPRNPHPSPLPEGEGIGQGAEGEGTGGGFDCVIGNPPWERIKLQEREFFSLPAPEIATATNAAKRRQMVAKLESDDPALFERYQEALTSADALLTYCRKSEQYPLTGRGDINLYAVFAELASQLVAPHGRVGLLTPSGIASDMTTKDFFASIAENNRLIRLYDFENRTKKFFPEVDNRFKFCILNFGGALAAAALTPGPSPRGRGEEGADFVFFVHRVEELEDRKRHVALSGADIKLLNPNTRTCPIFRTKRDAEITKAIYRRVPILIDESRSGPTGNPWGIKFKTMFHQTNDAEQFREAKSLKDDGFKLKGNHWIKGKQAFLPLYEAKMVQAYDHRAADVVTDEANWVRQGQTDKRTLVQWQNPEQLGFPRFWIESTNVELPIWGSIGFKDITSPTNQRTMISAFGPLAGYTNHFVLLRSEIEPKLQACLLANLNSFVYDYCTRQKIGGVTLNFFIVEQIPTLTPDVYAKTCPWKRQKLETWISERVLKLTCTAEDMLPLADACEFTGGSFAAYDGRLNKWDEEERARLMAELDAAYFHLYGIDRDDAEYILSTFKGIHDRSPLLPDSQSTAEFILSEYDRLGEA